MPSSGDSLVIAKGRKNNKNKKKSQDAEESQDSKPYNFRKPTFKLNNHPTKEKKKVTFKKGKSLCEFDIDVAKIEPLNLKISNNKRRVTSHSAKVETKPNPKPKKSKQKVVKGNKKVERIPNSTNLKENEINSENKDSKEEKIIKNLDNEEIHSESKDGQEEKVLTNLEIKEVNSEIKARKMEKVSTNSENEKMPTEQVHPHLHNELTEVKKLKRKKKGVYKPKDINDPIYQEPFKYGWTREVVYRSSSGGATADVYYWSPQNSQKFRTIKTVEAYLKENNSPLTSKNFTLHQGPITKKDTSKEIVRKSYRSSSELGTPVTYKKKKKEKVNFLPQNASTNKSSKDLITINPSELEQSVGTDEKKEETLNSCPQATSSNESQEDINCIKNPSYHWCPKLNDKYQLIGWEYTVLPQLETDQANDIGCSNCLILNNANNESKKLPIIAKLDDKNNSLLTERSFHGFPKNPLPSDERVSSDLKLKTNNAVQEKTDVINFIEHEKSFELGFSNDSIINPKSFPENLFEISKDSRNSSHLSLVSEKQEIIGSTKNEQKSNSNLVFKSDETCDLKPLQKNEIVDPMKNTIKKQDSLPNDNVERIFSFASTTASLSSESQLNTLDSSLESFDSTVESKNSVMHLDTVITSLSTTKDKSSSANLEQKTEKQEVKNINTLPALGSCLLKTENLKAENNLNINFVSEASDLDDLSKLISTNEISTLQNKNSTVTQSPILLPEQAGQSSSLSQFYNHLETGYLPWSFGNPSNESFNKVSSIKKLPTQSNSISTSNHILNCPGTMTISSQDVQANEKKIIESSSGCTNLLTKEIQCKGLPKKRKIFPIEDVSEDQLKLDIKTNLDPRLLYSPILNDTVNCTMSSLAADDSKSFIRTNNGLSFLEQNNVDQESASKQKLDSSNLENESITTTPILKQKSLKKVKFDIKNTKSNVEKNNSIPDQFVDIIQLLTEKSGANNSEIVTELKNDNSSFRCTSTELLAVNEILDSSLENENIRLSGNDYLDAVLSNSSSTPIKRKNSEVISLSSKKLKYNSTSTHYHLYNMESFCSFFNSLKMIFKYLNVEDLIVASKVCKAWRELATLPSLWRKVKIYNDQLTEVVAAALRDLRTYHLVVVERKPASWPIFLDHIPSITSLRELDISDCPSYVIEDITESCPQITTIMASTIKSDKLNLNNFDCLNRPDALILKSVKGITLQGDLTSFTGFSELTYLSLTTIKNLGKSFIQALIYLKNLETLELGDCTDLPNKFGLNVLSKLISLRRLRLEKVDGTCCNQDILSAISNLKNLTKLELVNINVKNGFEEHLPLCENIEELLVVPIIGQINSTLLNTIILQSTSRLSKNLKRFVWGTTENRIEPPRLFSDLDNHWMQVNRSFLSFELMASLWQGEKVGKMDICKIHHQDLFVSVYKFYEFALPQTEIEIFSVPFQSTWSLFLVKN